MGAWGYPMHSSTPDTKSIPTLYEEIKRNLPSEGSFFTCRKESLQWQIEAKKCSCHSSWCDSCWKRYGKKALVSRLQSMDWKHVRHLVLSVDPALYRNGEEAYDDITHRRGIGNLVKNLERTDGIKIVDYAGSLEWYENGFPHWHIFIETEEEGRAGMIGHGKIKRRWPFGIYVNEDYIKSEVHWRNLTGYFNSHGYFEKGKGYQGVLPEWAKDSERRIKRWFRKKSEGNGGKRRSRVRLNKSFGSGEGFSTGAKCEKCSFKRECEDVSDGRGCREGDKTTNHKIVSERIETNYSGRRKTYRAKLEACGAKSVITIDGIDIRSGKLLFSVTDVYDVPYEILRKVYPWEYIQGVGLTVSLDEQGFGSFVSVIEFLGSGKYRMDGIEPKADGSGAWVQELMVS